MSCGSTTWSPATKDFLRTRLIPAYKEMALFLKTMPALRPDGRSSSIHPSRWRIPPNPGYRAVTCAQHQSPASTRLWTFCHLRILTNLIDGCKTLGIEEENIPHTGRGSWQIFHLSAGSGGWPEGMELSPPLRGELQPPPCVPPLRCVARPCHHPRNQARVDPGLSLFSTASARPAGRLRPGIIHRALTAIRLRTWRKPCRT